MPLGRLIVLDNKLIMVKALHKSSGNGRGKNLLIPFEFLVATHFPDYVKIELDIPTQGLLITPCTEEEIKEYKETYFGHESKNSTDETPE